MIRYVFAIGSSTSPAISVSDLAPALLGICFYYASCSSLFSTAIPPPETTRVFVRPLAILFIINDHSSVLLCHWTFLHGQASPWRYRPPHRSMLKTEGASLFFVISKETPVTCLIEYDVHSTMELFNVAA